MARLNRFIVLLLSFSLAACSLPSAEVYPDSFGPEDSIRCSTGGGDAQNDLLVFRGNGQLTYQPLEGQSIKRKLTPEQTQATFQKLVAAGLYTVTDVPNRAVERFGVLLEVEVGKRKIRGTIGVLEMQKTKHRKWQDLLGILTGLLEE